MCPNCVHTKLSCSGIFGLQQLFLEHPVIQGLYETNHYLLPIRHVKHDSGNNLITFMLSIKDFKYKLISIRVSLINFMNMLFIIVYFYFQTRNAFIWVAEAVGLIDCVGRLWSAGCHSYMEQFTSIGKAPILIFSLSKECNFSKIPCIKYFPK